METGLHSMDWDDSSGVDFSSPFARVKTLLPTHE